MILSVAGGLDLSVRTRLLVGKIIGRKTNHHESLIFVLSYSASSAEYRGVHPQELATLTTSGTFPLHLVSKVGFPSIALSW